MSKNIKLFFTLLIIISMSLSIITGCGASALGNSGSESTSAVAVGNTTAAEQTSVVEQTPATELTTVPEQTTASEPTVVTQQPTTAEQSATPEQPATPVNVETPGEQQSTANGEEKVLKKVKARAIYLSGPSAGSTKVLDKYINLINTTELNAVVIDIKESGVVNYPSTIPYIADKGLFKKYYDPQKILQKLHDNDIYVIGRIVVFRDNGLANANKSLAIKNNDGSLWQEGKNGAWTSPYLEEVWDYNIEIAAEAIKLGFDEIQFDYTRFPTGRTSQINYGSNNLTKVEAINSFIKKAAGKIRDELGVPLSVDVFGIIAESVSDGKAIGQDLETVGLDLDYICPMVYPSHYAPGQIVNGVKFAKPDFDPYGVVYQTLLKTKNRIALVENYRADVRPYLQDFTASYLKEGNYQTYGIKQVRQQIQAVYDAGYEEWILWDGNNTYTEGALEKE